MDTKAAEAVFFDVESGKRIKSWKTTSSGSIMYSPDGRWVAIGGGDAGVSIHEAETGKQIQRLGTKAWPVTFSPDGRWLAAMAGTKMELWEVATGLQGRTIEGGASDASALEFNHAVFTPDSRYIISVNESALRLWEVRTGREVHQWPVEGYAGEIALSADGRWLVLTGTHLTVWRRAE
jgi:WD40 repeat protein